MPIQTQIILTLLVTIAVAFIVSFAATPIIKTFAKKVGAMDVPDDSRRVHDHPIPRLGGLAIFLGFVIAVLLFAEISTQVQGILLGCVIIVATGAVDDLISLNAWVKFALQILAAAVAVMHGLRIDVLMNPAFWMVNEYLILGKLAVPITIFWIVAITNSVNLIDGLDGLAVGVSTISSVTMLIIALLVSDANVALILAALAGACIGFMPYNMNPAKIFMGDTGALLLGYVLATVSVMGLFKFYAIVSFAVPLLALAVPLFDTAFAFIRRLFKGQSPFSADRGHFHHRLMDMGLNQKQAVAVLYSISGILGLAAVVIASSDELRALILILGFCLCALVWAFIYRSVKKSDHSEAAPPEESELDAQKDGEMPSTKPSDSESIDVPTSQNED